MPFKEPHYFSYAASPNVCMPVSTFMYLPRVMLGLDKNFKPFYDAQVIYTPPGNGSGTDFAISKPSRRVCKILNNQFYYPVMSTYASYGWIKEDALGNMLGTGDIAAYRTYVIDCGPRVTACAYPNAHVTNQATVDGAFVYPRYSEPIFGVQYDDPKGVGWNANGTFFVNKYLDSTNYPGYYLTIPSHTRVLNSFIVSITYQTNYQLQGYVNDSFTFLIPGPGLNNQNINNKVTYVPCSDDTGKTAASINKQDCIVT